MNLLWCVLETHQGTLNQTGSLTHFFAVLEKTRLGGKHPDYHTLLAALTQILHSLILNTWLTECNYPSLCDYAKANPMPNDLLLHAHMIIQKYASPVLCFSAYFTISITQTIIGTVFSFIITSPYVQLV
jgi:hypothetical protein